jgi:hypothetical protein
MAELGLNIMFSDSIIDETRLLIEGELRGTGFGIVSSNDRLIYESFGTSPENIIIECLGFVGLAFVTGFAAKAGADAWDSLKTRLSRIRAIHRGGLELEFLTEEDEGAVRYVLPQSMGDAEAALGCITADLQALTASDERERWWIGPPESRWGTGLESIEYRVEKNK